MSSKLYGKIVVAVFIAAVALLSTACGGGPSSPTSPNQPTVVHFATAHYVRDTASQPYYPAAPSDSPAMALKIMHKVLRNNEWVWDENGTWERNAWTKTADGDYTITINLDFQIGDEYQIFVGDPQKGLATGHDIYLDGHKVSRFETGYSYGEYYQWGLCSPADASGALR